MGKSVILNKGMRVQTALAMLQKTRPNLVFAVSICQWSAAAPNALQVPRYTITVLSKDSTNGVCLVSNHIGPLKTGVSMAIDLVRGCRDDLEGLERVVADVVD